MILRSVHNNNGMWSSSGGGCRCWLSRRFKNLRFIDESFEECCKKASPFQYLYMIGRTDRNYCSDQSELLFCLIFLKSTRADSNCDLPRMPKNFTLSNRRNAKVNIIIVFQPQTRSSSVLDCLLLKLSPQCRENVPDHKMLNGQYIKAT